MNTKTINKLETSEKINIIFSYLFSEDKSNEEEFFWNSLKKEEIKNFETIDKNIETFDFSDLKSEIL
jgi:hypothetical protein